VVTHTDTLTPPCGACRQLIWEFCGDVPVISRSKGQKPKNPMRELFPNRLIPPICKKRKSENEK